MIIKLSHIIITIIAILLALVCYYLIYKRSYKTNQQRQDSQDAMLLKFLSEQKEQVVNSQVGNLKAILDSIQSSMQDVRLQISGALNSHSSSFLQQWKNLNSLTDQALQNISGTVNKQLNEGLEKTTAAYSNVVERLATIDELSKNIVNLQSILTDKKTRGTFGEMQLSMIIHNSLPKETFALQYQLPNNTRADCILFLPKPSGNIVIDSKFPLENYQKFTNPNLDPKTKQQALQDFHQDISSKIKEISEKYIIPNETTDSAIMFIPAESIFAEIHENHPKLVELSHRYKVWLTSPATLMALITTVRAIIRDNVSKEQLNTIKEQLNMLNEDFKNFDVGLTSLGKQLQKIDQEFSKTIQAGKNITKRFASIKETEISY